MSHIGLCEGGALAPGKHSDARCEAGIRSPRIDHPVVVGSGNYGAGIHRPHIVRLLAVGIGFVAAGTLGLDIAHRSPAIATAAGAAALVALFARIHMYTGCVGGPGGFRVALHD